MGYGSREAIIIRQHGLRGREKKEGGAETGEATFFLGSFVMRLDDSCHATLWLTCGLAAKDIDARYLSS
jgi:hypothetical protein